MSNVLTESEIAAAAEVALAIQASGRESVHAAHTSLIEALGQERTARAAAERDLKAERLIDRCTLTRAEDAERARDAARVERDAARAKLAEVEAERSRWRKEAGDYNAEANVVRNEKREAQRALDEQKAECERLKEVIETQQLANVKMAHSWDAERKSAESANGRMRDALIWYSHATRRDFEHDGGSMARAALPPAPATTAEQEPACGRCGYSKEQHALASPACRAFTPGTPPSYELIDANIYSALTIVSEAQAAQEERDRYSSRGKTHPALESLYAPVLTFFAGNRDKANLWFVTSNPLLGGLTPIEMIECGKKDKLRKFIETQLAENDPPGTTHPAPEPVMAEIASHWTAEERARFQSCAPAAPPAPSFTSTPEESAARLAQQTARKIEAAVYEALNADLATANAARVQAEREAATWKEAAQARTRERDEALQQRDYYKEDRDRLLALLKRARAELPIVSAVGAEIDKVCKS